MQPLIHWKWLLIVLLPTPLALGQVGFRPEGQGYESGTVILPRAEFTESSLVRRCLSMRVKKNTSFVDIEFFSSEEDAGEFRLMGKFGNHTPYDSWRPAYNSLVATRMPIAEFVRI